MYVFEGGRGWKLGGRSLTSARMSRRKKNIICDKNHILPLVVFLIAVSLQEGRDTS